MTNIGTPETEVRGGERETEREREIAREGGSERERESERARERETERESDRLRGREAERERERKYDRERARRKHDFATHTPSAADNAANNHTIPGAGPNAGTMENYLSTAVRPD